MVYHNGQFYFGVLGTFPVRPGTQNIYKMTPSGQIKVVASGLTTVLGVAFDRQGRLYALESMTVAGFPGPQDFGSGKVVRVNSDGSLSPIATGLTFPTAMIFNPAGDALYVSNNGFTPGRGAGQISYASLSSKPLPLISEKYLPSRVFQLVRGRLFLFICKTFSTACFILRRAKGSQQILIKKAFKHNRSFIFQGANGWAWMLSSTSLIEESA